jgi:predicted Rossmann fold flavoprotein
LAEADVVVVGGGAAGLMCAAEAAKRGRKVVLIEHAEKVGKKILISGGGRCNFTNLGAAPENFLSDNPRFCISALRRYTQHDFIDLVQKHRIAFHEKTLGQLFCDGSARQVVAMMLAECSSVDVHTGTRVTAIHKSDRFRLETDRGEIFCQSLVLATGGLSIPKIGATGFAHEQARRFGLALTETRPALVPMTLKVPDIAGVSLPVVATLGKVKFREAMLFTHRGLSGPAILQISSYWKPGQEIAIDLLPDLDAPQFLKERRHARPKAELRTILGEAMPARLAEVMAAEKPERLNDWRIVPTGTEGYAKAEVTVGGVDTAELSSQTMEAKKVPGLYVIGEAVDVTGWLGGYNFQWAWSSGWVAGQYC